MTSRWRHPLRALDAWLMAPAPAARLATLRLLVGGYALVYLAIRSVHLLSYAEVEPIHFAPVGVVRVLDAPLPGWAVVAVFAATVAATVGFVAGWRHRVVGPLFSALLLWQLTYENCFQQVLHTTNLLAIYGGLLGITASADTLSLDARRRGPPRQPTSWRYGWPIRLMAIVCVTSYVVAGVAKLKRSGLDYVGQDVLRIHVAFDNLRKIELGSFHSPVGAWLLPWDWMWVVLGALTLVIELGAPLALLGRRAAWIWSSAAWLFHLGVLLTMMIFFSFPLLGIAFAPLFHVEQLSGIRRQASGWLRWARAPLRRRRAQGAGRPGP